METRDHTVPCFIPQSAISPKNPQISQIPKFFPKRCWNSQSRDKFPKSGNPGGNPGIMLHTTRNNFQGTMPDWIWVNYFFSFWTGCSNHRLIALDLGTNVEQPFDCLIVQNRVARLALLEPKTRNFSLLRSNWLQNFYLANCWLFCNISLQKFFLEKCCEWCV